MNQIMSFRSLALGIALSVAAAFAHASDPDLRWQWHVEPQHAQPGDEAEIVFSAAIPAGFILYSSDFQVPLGPRPAKFIFESSDAVELHGPIRAVNSQRRTDKTFGTEYTYFAERAEFRQKVRILKTGSEVSGRIDGQTCQEKDGLCALFKQPFVIRLN
jgi:hypothetical protein